tara:strand:+ start:152 stop:544 length:393 start_codon:yes stop_codon:yes gene_type:complete
MNCKRTNKEIRKLISLPFNIRNVSYGFETGIIYTLYSDKFNLIKIGFAENNEVLETKLMKKNFILLDKKKGKKRELNLLIKTLNEFNIKFSDNLNFQYSNILMKHLSILGWPVGRSLYKQRKIKKELSCA